MLELDGSRYDDHWVRSNSPHGTTSVIARLQSRP
jgi:hypothetical protein